MHHNHNPTGSAVIAHVDSLLAAGPATFQRFFYRFSQGKTPVNSRYSLIK